MKAHKLRVKPNSSTTVIPRIVRTVMTARNPLMIARRTVSTSGRKRIARRRTTKVIARIAANTIVHNTMISLAVIGMTASTT